MMNQPHLIFRNTVALALAKLMEKGANAVLSFFVARYLGASALGVYSAALVFLALISLSAEMGSNTFLVREIARDRARTGAYVVHFGIITVSLSFAVMAVALVIVPHLGYSAELTASLYVIIFSTIPAVLRIIQEAVFLAHQRAAFIVWSTFGGAILNAGGSLVLLHRGHGIVSIVVVYAVVQYVITLFYFGFLNRYICRLRWRFNLQFAWTLISQVKAFTASSILGGLLARPEILILSLFRSDAQIGFYSAALRVVDLWSVIPETYMKNVFPVLSHAYVTDRPRCQVILDKSIKYLLVISLPLMFGILAVARPVIHLLYGPGFEPAIPVLRVLACCIPLSFLFEFLWRVLAARDQQQLMLRAQIILAAVRLMGGYLLIGWLGSIGAAISAASFVAGLDLLMGLYARRDGTRLHIFRAGWRLSLAALGMGAVAAVLVSRSELWLVAATAGVLYTIMLILLKALSREDLALFRRIWQVRTAV
jgi:O-antigen/teichoic acid export membrane protein